MTSQSADLDWDDLLDDYEDRIDAIWSVLEDDGELLTEPFIAPVGSAKTPDQAQLDRFHRLSLDAAEAASELTKRLQTNRGESSNLQLGSKARRAYVGTKRLGR